MQRIHANNDGYSRPSKGLLKSHLGGSVTLCRWNKHPLTPGQIQPCLWLPTKCWSSANLFSGPTTLRMHDNTISSCICFAAISTQRNGTVYSSFAAGVRRVDECWSLDFISLTQQTHNEYFWYITYVTIYKGQLSLAIPSWVDSNNTRQRAVLFCSW